MASGITREKYSNTPPPKYSRVSKKRPEINLRRSRPVRRNQLLKWQTRSVCASNKSSSKKDGICPKVKLAKWAALQWAKAAPEVWAIQAWGKEGWVEKVIASRLPSEISCARPLRRSLHA